MHRSLLPFTWWKFIGAALAQTGKKVILIKAHHSASQFHHSSQICSFHPSLHRFLKSYRILCLPWSILLLHTGVKPVLKAWQNNLSLSSLEDRLTFSSASLYPAASSTAYFKSWRHNSHPWKRGRHKIVWNSHWNLNFLLLSTFTLQWSHTRKKLLNLGPRTFPSSKLKVYKLDSWFPINSKMTLSRKQLVAKTSLWKARNFKSSDEILFSESTIDLKDYPISRSPGKHQKKVPSKHFWVVFIHWFQERSHGHLPDMFLYHTLLYNWDLPGTFQVSTRWQN